MCIQYGMPELIAIQNRIQILVESYEQVVHEEGYRWGESESGWKKLYTGQLLDLPLEAMKERCLNAVSLDWREVRLISCLDASEVEEESRPRFSRPIFFLRGVLLGCISSPRRIKA